MPGVIIETEFLPPLAFLTGLLDVAAKDMEDFSKPLKTSVEKVIAPSIAKNFDAGGRPKWTPLSEATVQMRGQQGSTLVRTGTLKDSASSPGLWEISQTDALLPGLPVWYGNLHQMGFEGTDRAHPIPARPFIMFQEEDVTAIEEVFVAWLTDVWMPW
jgi:phage virion morphogenesis protein